MKPVNTELWKRSLKIANTYYKLKSSANSYAIKLYIQKGGKFSK
jgi:hypothetical protein